MASSTEGETDHDTATFTASGRQQVHKQYKKDKGKGKKDRTKDLPFISDEESSNQLPPCTSKWNIYCLESLHICYSDKFLPFSALLDMVYDQTGMFGPLTSAQKDCVKSIQDSIEFSFSVDEVQYGYHKTFIEAAAKGLKRDMEKQIKSLSLLGRMEDFTASVVVMIMHASKRYKAGEQISKAVFVDLFKDFVKICGLFPSQGEEYKSNVAIQQNSITSTADVVILAGDILSVPSVADPVTVVSIVDVKNAVGKVPRYQDGKLNKKTKPVRSTSISDVSSTSDSVQLLHEEPEIFRSILKKVLSQHGAKLLIHGVNTFGNTFYSVRKKCKLFPGMIVIGTEVTFTLMEISDDHISEVLKKKVVDKGKSFIHYSELKDMLKKEDRDQLLEAFLRLNNIKLE